MKDMGGGNFVMIGGDGNADGNIDYPIDVLTCPQKSDPIVKLGSKEKKLWLERDLQPSRSSVNCGKQRFFNQVG
jgi:hypothetical protein